MKKNNNYLKNIFIFNSLLYICLLMFLSFDIFIEKEAIDLESDFIEQEKCNYFIQESKDLQIKYLELPVFPEIENLQCLGKIIDIDKNSRVVILGSNNLVRNSVEIINLILLLYFSLTLKSRFLYIILIGIPSLNLLSNILFQTFYTFEEIFYKSFFYFFLLFFFNITFRYPVNLTSIQKNSFRSDINFLRFFSVSSVVLYHIEFPYFGGGWLGVDIFFVISGFLICSSIIDGLNKKKFSFKHFYIRRINRILPSLYVLLFITFILSRLILSEKAIYEFNKSFLSVVGLLANYFFRGNNLYTAEPSNLIPLLHTWSLSIEEQFYLIFPLLIFLVFKYKKKLTPYLILFAITYSLILNLGTFENNDMFYITKFRIWEICIGVLLVFIDKIKLNLNKVVYFAGYLIIIITVLFNDGNVFELFPKMFAIFGVSLILLNNKPYPELEKFFNLKTINIIGLSSYSIYLYHQPIFSFYRNIKENYLIKLSLKDFTNFENNKIFDYLLQNNNLSVLILLLVTLIFGIYSYQKIELTFIGNENLNKNIFALFFSIILLCTFVWIENLNYEELKENLESNTPIYDKNISELEIILKEKGFKREIYVVGDSHMDMQNQFNYLESNNFKIYKFIEGNCFYIKDFYVSDLNLNPWCKDMHELTSEKLENIKNSIVLFGGILPNYIEEDQFFNGYVKNSRRTNKLFVYKESNKKIPNFEDIKVELNKTIFELTSNNNIVVLIYPIPEASWNIEKINKLVPDFNKINLHFDEKFYISRSKKSFILYDSIDNNNVVRVIPSSILCNNYLPERCVVNFDGKLFYKDYDHLSAYGNELLVDLIIKNLISELSK